MSNDEMAQEIAYRVEQLCPDGFLREHVCKVLGKNLMYRLVLQVARDVLNNPRNTRNPTIHL